MPECPDGHAPVETTVPEDWKEKMEREKKQKGVKSMRQYLRNMIYESLIKDQDQS